MTIHEVHTAQAIALLQQFQKGVMYLPQNRRRKR